MNLYFIFKLTPIILLNLSQSAETTTSVKPNGIEQYFQSFSRENVLRSHEFLITKQHTKKSDKMSCEAQKSIKLK